MSNTIFTVELPFVKTDEELEKIQNAHSYDPYFITSGCIKEYREKFDILWKKYQPYADSDFLNQIKKYFHQRSWEMYMGNVLLNRNLLLNKKDFPTPAGEGPDFILVDNTYLECTACTRGDKNKSDSVSKMVVTKLPNKMKVLDVPVDKMILRITQRIKDKALEQYKKWETKKWFDSKMPFIIAVNTADVEYFQDYFGIPIIIQALFGLEFLKIDSNNRKSFSWRKSIKKQNSNIPVNYFTNADFGFVSGILFSDKTVLNQLDNIGDDCIFVNNPYAKNPVSESFTKHFKNWIVTKNNNEGNLMKNY